MDVDHLPKVTRKNVLILKYYSFENYFLNPEIMSKLGVIESEDAFYEILYDKWREYLHRIKSGVHLIQMMGRDFTSPVFVLALATVFAVLISIPVEVFN